MPIGTLFTVSYTHLDVYKRQVIGLFVTLFAFLGVNMFLSGLHSYGSLEAFRPLTACSHPN